MSLNQETHKSCGTNAMVAFIGGLLSLALGLQCGWGTWGLVATIFPCSALGWIVADWRGFVEAIKRGLRETRKIFLGHLPLALRRLGKYGRRIWQRHKDYTGETGAILCLLVIVPISLLLFAMALEIILAPSKTGVFPAVEFSGRLALSLMLSFLAVLFLMLFYDLPDQKRTEMASFWARIFSNTGNRDERRKLIQKNYPEIWEKAGMETRVWSYRFFLRWNLVCLPFTLLIFALKGLWWVLARTPQTLWGAVKCLYFVGVCVVNIFCEVLPFTYFYANSDKRRIAFSSIALGITIGFAVGYPLKLMLPGALLCGFATYLIGVAQHHLVYPKLLARRAQATS